MQFVRIAENSLSSFEDILFFENHTLGIPMIMMGAVDEGKPVAAAALEVDGSVARLISLYVEKPYRRKGVGTEIVREVFSFAKGSGLDAVEIDFVPAEGLQEFFEHTGFFLFFGNEVLYLPVGEVVKTKQFRSFLEKADKSLECVPFSALSDRQIRAAYHKEGIMYDEALREQVNADCSAVLMANGNEQAGLITVLDAGNDLIISELRAGDYGYSGYAALFSHQLSTLKNRLDKDIYMGFIGADDKKLELVSEIAGDMIDFEKGETIVHGVLV